MAESPSEAPGPGGPLFTPAGLQGELGVPVPLTSLWVFAVCQCPHQGATVWIQTVTMKKRSIRMLMFSVCRKHTQAA